MGFFSDPYGQQQLRDAVENDPQKAEVKQRMLRLAAERHFTGTLPFPGESYKFKDGNIVAHNLGGGWKKFAISAAVIIGGGIAAGGGLAAGTGVEAGGQGVAKKLPDPKPGTGREGSLWNKLVGPLATTAINAGTDLIGTKLKVDADKKASEEAAKAAEDALAWQKDVYAQRQRQLAPAIGVGNGATVKLGELMGIPTPDGGYQPPPAPGTPAPAPAAAPAPAPTTPAPAPAAPVQNVRMQAPNNGPIAMVPPDQVAHYEQLGAVVLP